VAGLLVGRDVANAIKRVIEPTNNTDEAKTKRTILNRNLPDPNFSTGVGLGMIADIARAMMGRIDSVIVYVAPKRVSPLIFFWLLGFNVKKLVVREIMFQIMMKTTEPKRPMTNFEAIGFQPKRG